MKKYEDVLSSYINPDDVPRNPHNQCLTLLKALSKLNQYVDLGRYIDRFKADLQQYLHEVYGGSGDLVETPIFCDEIGFQIGRALHAGRPNALADSLVYRVNVL